jgi:hypothetical protein
MVPIHWSNSSGVRQFALGNRVALNMIREIESPLEALKIELIPPA